MHSRSNPKRIFPPWVRWGCVVWLAVWIPAYERSWGWANFLHLCDIAVLLSCIGFWWNSSLLLSSQAVSTLVGGAAWALDAGWRLFSGKNLVGGTEYLWDARFPLWVRLLSLFHIGLPVALLWAVRRVGYDRRALAVQSAIAAAALVLSRFFSPARNLNFAYKDAVFHRSWGPAPAHLAVVFLGFVALTYWPAHFMLSRFFAPVEPAPSTDVEELRD